MSYSEEIYGVNSYRRNLSGGSLSLYQTQTREKSKVGRVVFSLIVLGILGFVLYKLASPYIYEILNKYF